MRFSVLQGGEVLFVALNNATTNSIGITLTLELRQHMRVFEIDTTHYIASRL